MNTPTDIQRAIEAEHVLARDLENYIGLWVAIREHRVVAHANTLDAVLEDNPGRTILYVTHERGPHL